jgi:hypothetical protein
MTTSEDNEVAAERVIEALEVRCRALIEMPNGGRKREDLARGRGLRSVVEGNYLILQTGLVNRLLETLHFENSSSHQNCLSLLVSTSAMLAQTRNFETLRCPWNLERSYRQA